jgi:hypothetical protein
MGSLPEWKKNEYSADVHVTRFAAKLAENLEV